MDNDEIKDFIAKTYGFKKGCITIIANESPYRFVVCGIEYRASGTGLFIAPREMHGEKKIGSVLSKRGEDAAARYLERKGYVIAERSWTCAAGKADIIAYDEEALVFVQVTDNAPDDWMLDADLDVVDRKRSERIAALFLQGHEVVDVQVRFDVISLQILDNDRALIRHHVNALAVA